VSWRRLKHLASIAVSNVDKKTVSDERSVRLCNYTDVYYNERITAELPFMEATASADQIASFGLRADDVLLTKDSETPDDIAVAAYVVADLPDVVCGYHLALLRPSQEVDGRYLFWALGSRSSREQFSASANGITRFGLRYDSFGEVLVPLPPIATQRAIADYLDQETARIDALIEKKGKLVSLLQSRVETVVENHIRQLVEEYGSTPLKYAVRRVEVGIVITPSVWYGDEGGVPALRGLNVQPGRIDVTDLVYLTEEGHEVHRKSVLRQGDVVVVRTGQAGAAAVVPSELDGCNCIDLVIVRPSPELVPQFLEYVLNSDWTQKHVEEYSVGTIQSHFNVGAMKQLPIPLPPLGRQSQEVEKLGTERAAIEELKECLTRQIDLLTEHRQALITAAVTGELEIPGVAA
jgi:type I restriction enzyme S subunit